MMLSQVSRVQTGFVLSIHILSTLKMPSTEATLPIIDIAPFLNTDAQDATKRASASAALHAACVEYGFFYLNISSYVDMAEPEELTLIARQFFALPQREKDELALKNQDYARGCYCFTQSLNPFDSSDGGRIC